MLRRNCLGRVEGSGFAFHDYDEQESWKDQKIKNVVFPNHTNKQPSEIRLYRIGENGELVKVN